MLPLKNLKPTPADISPERRRIIQALKDIVITPSIITLSPSYEECAMSQFRIVNPTDYLVAFKVRATQAKYLTTKPPCGVMDPQKGAHVSLKLRRIVDTSFKLSGDRVSIYLAVLPFNCPITDPIVMWRENKDLLKLCVSKELHVHYSTTIGGEFRGLKMKETPRKRTTSEPDADDESDESENED